MNKNTHFIKENHGATIPSYDLARNILEVSVTAICKHGTGITKMSREPLRRTVDQFGDEKSSYFIKHNSIYLFSCTSLPTIAEARNVAFKSTSPRVVQTALT